MELGVLGPLQVRQYGLPVSIPGAKPRAILTMLGLHGDSVVSADTLVELLWGDDPPRTVAKALQTHISSLRRVLGDGFVLTAGTGWTLSTTEVDATRYKLAAKMGRAAAASGDISQAVVHFDEALSLWRGIPELPDGPRGVPEKTRWVEGHAALVEDRADALLATGRAAEIIGELEAAIADAPLRERRWGQLMLALYRAGRQGEALAAYQRARSLLADELGVDPGPSLRRLEAAIVSQDDALEIPVSQHLSTVTKAVTFLLTDIEGSTAAWEAQANAMAVALARHDEIVEQVVTSRGGRLIKTRGEGDATFSVFDRPSGAAAAAIELQEAIRHEPWVLSEPMRIRVALHSGEVELRDGDYFGRAVNRAARLRSLAAGGQILCSGATAELVIDTLSDDVLLIDLGSRHLKNLARPEHVFELRLETTEYPSASTADAPPMERPDLPAVLAGPGPFVGRVSELERLLAGWQLTLDAGTSAVLIAGEPGVGKTRLAGEWTRQAYEQGAVVLYGRCDEDLGAPYQPFAEALRSLVPCVGANRLRGLRGVEALLALVPGLTEVLPDLTAPSRADADTERYALFDAVVALLGIASASAPVVLVLDDLHWAAKPTLLLLRHLLRFGEHARVQIVGTYRSTDLDRSHPLAAMLADLHRSAGSGSANRIQLNGLDEDDVTAYVAEAGYDDEELARALASVTGGNPFFLIEALRHVDESGGHWDPSTLPQGVREAVSRRLSRLPAETNKALAAAAVVGSRFAVDLVERVVGEDLVDAFDQASKAGIVIEEPGGRYRFNHAIVRQSLLAELASVRRMRLHQRIAASLEVEQGADDELLAELAYHYFECAWAGNAAKAVDYCRRAADQAMARLAYEGAADLYDKALHALDELDDDLPDRTDLQAELLVARCEALLAAGDVGSAGGAVSQLQNAAADSARLAAWGTCFDGQLSMLTDPERLDEIETALGSAAEELAGLDDAAGEAKAHTVRAGCLARLGRIGDCETALDQALTAARRAGEHRRVNAVLAGAPLAALWGPNPVPRAGGRCLDVVRLLRITTGSPVVEATSTRCQGVLDAFRGRAAAGRQLIDSARRSLTELGMRHALLEVEQFAGIVEMVADDPASAEPHLRRAYNGFRRMGLEADTAETAALLARACLALGRDADADELCTESEDLSGHALKASIAWRTVRAQLLARGGAHDEARRVAAEAVTWAERTDLLVDHGDACLAMATVLDISGDAAGARAAAEKAVGLYELKGAAALAEKARRLLDGREVPTAAAQPDIPVVQFDNACVRALARLNDAAAREAWDEAEQLFASDVSVESHRKIVGYPRMDLPSGEYSYQMSHFLETGIVKYQFVPIAVHGERLALTRLTVGTADLSSGAPQDEMLQVVGVDEQGRIALQVVFDIEDFDAAMAELDAQHARLKDAPAGVTENECVRVLRALDDAYDRVAWDEVEQHVAAVVSVESRRRVVGQVPHDLPFSEWAAEAKRFREMLGAVRYRHDVVAIRGERVALTSLKVGPDDQSPGAPRDELLQLYGLNQEGRIALQIWFDVDDMDTAMAELDARHARLDGPNSRPALDNSASRVDHQVNTLVADSRWDDIAALFIDDIRLDDRRRGLSRVDAGRGEAIAELKTIADLGVTNIASDVIAIRGERLVLGRVRGESSGSEAYFVELLRIAEIDADGRVVGYVAFDLDDIDAAVAELDVRYLAGEAGPHSHTWSVMTHAYAVLNRRGLPATTPDWVNVDHRRGTSFAPGDMTAYISAAWADLEQDLRIHIEAVHRLSDRGAVLTQVLKGTTHERFDAEWRTINLYTVDGALIDRCELFEETDLDAALARFDELSRPAPQLENAASQVDKRFQACFAARDWDAMAEILSDGTSIEDRRRVVNAGNQHGRDAELTVHAYAAVGSENVASTVVAVRGQRLALSHYRFSGADRRPDAFRIELLAVAEIDADERMAAVVVFDPEDIDAAFAELDARYLAGEAADYARTWSAITQGYAAANRGELAATAPDVANIDHRRVAMIESGELVPYLRNTFDEFANIRTYLEAVHRVTDLGAVVTHVGAGTSKEGFDAEWRMINVIVVDGDLISRSETFEEGDLDAALAKFDELSRPAPRLENPASQLCERFLASFGDRDWDVIADLFAEGYCLEDRRRTVNSGVRRGRDDAIEDMRAAVDVGLWANLSSAVIATRGDRLALMHLRASGHDPEASQLDVLQVIETDADERFADVAVLDVEDVNAAIAELDARYLAGEAAPHAQTMSVITDVYTALNRHELSPTTADWVNIDHRQGAPFAPGDLIAYLRASWDQVPDMSFRIEAVHRLSELGAVFTQVMKGTSQEGFDAEWRLVEIMTVEGDVVSRAEIFDEADLDAALAKFDALNCPMPRLENAASRVSDHLRASFAARDWAAMGDLLADDFHGDDHRPLVNVDLHGPDAVVESFRAGAELGIPDATSIVYAIRGERLVLARVRYSVSDTEPDAFNVDLLQIVEIDGDERIAGMVTFDIDDIDAAFAELDARFVAREAAPHAQTWSVIVGNVAAFNKHEPPAWTPNVVNVDHRRVTAVAPGDKAAYIRATWDQTPDVRIHIEAAHRLNDLGAVVTYHTSGTSLQGFGAEWRGIAVSTIDGGRINRSELFDEADLDAALARFDELSRPVPRLENAASQMYDRFLAHFAAHEWDALAGILAVDMLHDDRRGLGAGIRYGRDAEIENVRATAGLGSINAISTVIATRGERLALTRNRFSIEEQGVDAFQLEVLGIVEINADNMIATRVGFDLDDIDAAFEELDSRYAAGEAAPYANTWSVIMGAYAAFNRREPLPTTPGWVNVDHRRGTTVASGDLKAFIRAAWDDTPDARIYIQAVHRLSEIGAVTTGASQGTSREGFDAEWREIAVTTVDDNKVSRSELFDEADLDAARARFDELSRPVPRLENTATKVEERFQAYFAARDWAAMGQVLADEIFADDRRRVVNAGIRHGRDAKIADMRATADLGTKNGTSTVVAIRGQRLALVRIRLSGRDHRPDAFHTEMLGIVEISADSRMAIRILFDVDDIDAAFAELDARYLAGEGAPHARTWSVIAEAYAAFNRRELAATTPDWVNIDHRRGAAFAPGDFIAYIRAAWDDSPDTKSHIAAVHRLSKLGAVVTDVTQGISQVGFDAEWREIHLLTVDGEMLSRSELFDEADLDTALARFDELNRPMPRLENAASRLEARCQALITVADWNAMAGLMSDDISIDDRRRVVNAGLRHGRDVVIEDLRVGKEIGLTRVTPTAIATRGELLTLRHIHYGADDQRPEGAQIDLVQIVEVGLDDRIRSIVLFDMDDIDDAFKELETRYLTGEAAAHARTWSVIAQTFAAFNRREHFATDWAFFDHRRHTPFAPSVLAASMHAVRDLTPDLKIYLDTVHRLSDHGAVVANTSHGTSPEGFDAEWQMIQLLTVDGDQINRCELFDEADLDAALARFDELSCPTGRLENAVSRTYERLLTHFAARDWAAMAEILAPDVFGDDRRRVVNAGVQHGRDALIASMQATAEVGVESMTPTVITTRGERLALTCVRSSVRRGEFTADVLSIVEIDADNRIAAGVVFDPADLDSAFEELDARYLAGEAADYAHTWSVMAQAFAATNRREIPEFTPDFVSIDHRRARAFAPGDLTAYIRATWDLAPDVIAYAEAVHRLSNFGAVFTQAVNGTSQHGFEAEWREICVATIEGDRINRIELFDETDLDAALARFDELHAHTPRLESAANQVVERFNAYFANRNWDAMAELLVDDFASDDRRRVVNSGVRRGRGGEITSSQAMAELGGVSITSIPIATRGKHLVLSHFCASADDQLQTEGIGVIEINTDNEIVARVMFDPNDLDAAFEELDARYLAGEAAAHSRTWSALARGYAAINRQELASTTLNWVSIDHRRGTAFAPGDLAAYLRAGRDLTVRAAIYIEAVHRLTNRGAVVSHRVYATSYGGFDAEWREIIIVMFEGDLINRCELFEEADLDVALATFHELSASASLLENAVTAVLARVVDAFNRRDIDSYLSLFDDDGRYEDRRKGLRDVGPIKPDYARAIVLEAGTGWQEEIECIAVRGTHLLLCRAMFRDHSEVDRPVVVEALVLAEVTDGGLISAFVIFDPDDINGAFAELTNRWIASGEVEHPEVIEAMSRLFECANRHDWDGLAAIEADAAYVNHRQLATGDEIADHWSSLRMMASLIPDLRVVVADVPVYSAIGVVTNIVVKGSTVEGAEIELPAVIILVFNGSHLTRMEAFDLDQRDQALARFDELNG
ncbi:BTAD domain-containing putative transcriptional regulator [Mycolicibacterium tusciae]|uniref:BTAD domain-containing putative transcriptional regulator n=1 Tax=Mycolicibacterium tusciae TaxID=75922 RepID=UPI0030149D6D